MPRPTALHIPSENGPCTLRFETFAREGADPVKFKKVLEIRQRVYRKYGYLTPESASQTEDSDVYDDAPDTIYCVAFVGDRLVGALRMIRRKPLPITKFFSFDTPEKAVSSSQQQCEIGRLVVERTPEDRVIPRNVILLFMADQALAFAEANGITIGFGFVKQKLLKKLALLRFPISEIHPHQSIYPHDGSMAPYFYEQKDDLPIPCWMEIGDVQDFISKTIRSGRLFATISGTEYALRETMYTSLLKKLGIL